MMKKLILVGVACFVLGVIVGCVFGPYRYKLYFAPKTAACFKIDNLTGNVWKSTYYVKQVIDHGQYRDEGAYSRFEFCSSD